jgi:hypothetical protein
MSVRSRMPASNILVAWVCRPLWSGRILAEAQAATEEIHPGIDAAKRFAQMREAFDDALVSDREELDTGQ